MSLHPLELLTQLVLIVVVFSLCMKLFFGKLLWVLQEREAKTTLLMEEANRRMIEADEVAAQYKNQVEDAYRRAQRDLKKEKEEITLREDRRYRGEEDQVTRQIEEKRRQIIHDAASHKERLLEEADALAAALSKRFVDDN